MITSIVGDCHNSFFSCFLPFLAKKVIPDSRFSESRSPGRSSPSAAALAVPPPPSPSRQPQYCGHGAPCPSASAVRPRLPSLPPPPPPTEADAPGRSSPSTAALAVPSSWPWRHDIPPPFPVGGGDTCGGIPTDERKGRKGVDYMSTRRIGMFFRY